MGRQACAMEDRACAMDDQARTMGGRARAMGRRARKMVVRAREMEGRARSMACQACEIIVRARKIFVRARAGIVRASALIDRACAMIGREREMKGLRSMCEVVQTARFGEVASFNRKETKKRRWGGRGGLLYSMVPTASWISRGAVMSPLRHGPCVIVASFNPQRSTDVSVC